MLENKTSLKYFLSKNNIFRNILFILLVVFIFNNLIIYSFAQENVNSYDYLKLDVKNNIEFKVNFEDNYRIEKFYLNSYFFINTINESQYLNKFSSTNNNYNLKIKSDIPYISFKYIKDNLNSVNNIKNEFIIESVKTHPKISKKIKYPLDKVDNQYLDYLKYTTLIDSDNDIRNKASELATGEDDLFLISAKIAKWIQEDINYDLKTALENPNQKSTDVFKSKKGVCKEITNLYVSMIRSLGIPARVVSGYAYTDSKELTDYLNSNWGGHAWAEVLIGDKWVPFDLTYNQYGYVDATHIILEKSQKSKPNNVKINASGYGFNLDKNGLKVNNKFTIINKEKYKQDNLFTIRLEGPDKLGFSSYGYIKTTIKNNKNYYQVLFLTLVKTKEIELLDSDKKMIILSPNEKKEIFFRYKIPDNLDKKYQYTFPFAVENEFLKKDMNVSVKSDFLDIKKIALPKKVIENKSYSSNKLSFDCNFIIGDKENNILCSIKNNNNYQISNLNLCISNLDNNNNSKSNQPNKCKKIDLKVNEEKSVSFQTKLFNTNINYSYSYRCNNSACVEKSNHNINIDKPRINIQNNQNQIKYNINNYLKGNSVGIYLNNKLITTSNKQNDSLLLDLENGNYSINIKLKLNNQIISENNISLIITNKINVNLNPNSNYTNLSFIDKILIWLKELFTYKK